MTTTVAQPSDSRRDAAFDCASLLVILIATVALFGRLDDYGIAWDETAHIAYGDRILEYYSSGLEPREGWRGGRLYNGGFDLLAGVIRVLVPTNAYRATHMAGGWVGLLACIGTWKLGRLCAGALGGLLALSFIVLTPVFFGHTLNNPKDPPFAAGYVWTVYYAAQIAANLRTSPTSTWVKFGLALGAAASVRLVGLCLATYPLFAIAVCTVLDASRRSIRAAAALSIPPLAKTVAAICCALATCFLTWPYLHRHLGAFWNNTGEIVHFRRHTAPTLFRGLEYSPFDLPDDYLPTYFALQLPEVVSFFAVVGCVLFVRRLLIARGGGRTEARPDRLAGLGLALLSAAGPPLLAIVVRATMYDGMRHFLFAVPPLCAVAGAGAASCFRWAWARSRAVGFAVTAAIVACLVDVAIAAQRLHPYEYVFYNHLIGGLRGAYSRYEDDYYGLSYAEANENLAKHLWSAEPATYLETDYSVRGCVKAFFFEPQLPPNFRYAAAPAAIDFHVAYTRHHCLSRAQGLGSVVARVERDGVILNEARDLRASRIVRHEEDGAEP